ncbi:MAG: archaetidylserine decarboxylase [Gammaproteobacteria bacterium]|nr:archaetidylserine decarboxylase [Gammaproteobacteria bacterium]
MSKKPKANIIDYSFSAPQYLLPHQALSKVMHRATRSRLKPFKSAVISGLTHIYGINMQEAEHQNRKSYNSVNAFFTRALKSGVREIDADPEAVVSPVDGTVSEAGPIHDQQIIQAKGRDYTVLDLLAGDKALADQFKDGDFATIYLSPKDYHRIHMPCDGSLQSMRHVPGRLFSVNPRTTRSVPRLFARNERVINVFETEFGPMVLIMVGAIFVSSMETVWHGEVNTTRKGNVREWQYDGSLKLAKGDEMGRFNMGSTVILLYPNGAVEQNSVMEPTQTLRLGQRIADLV